MDLGEQSYRAASSMANRDFTESALVGMNRQNPTGLLQYIKRRSNSRMVKERILVLLSVTTL
jgi:hypothetical protein